MQNAVKKAGRRPAPRRDRARINEEQRLNEIRRKERAATHYISSYFAGVEVPEHFDILSRKYVEMCVNMNICDAVDAAYAALKSSGRLQSECGDGTISEDVRFMIKTLKLLRKKCIPQEFSAGILMMHLEILEGMSFSSAT